MNCSLCRPLSQGGCWLAALAQLAGQSRSLQPESTGVDEKGSLFQKALPLHRPSLRLRPTLSHPSSLLGHESQAQRLLTPAEIQLTRPHSCRVCRLGEAACVVLGRRSPSASRIDTLSRKLTRVVCLIKENSVVTSGVRVRVGITCRFPSRAKQGRGQEARSKPGCPTSLSGFSLAPWDFGAWL